MKFATPTLLAILATSAVVGAAPTKIEATHSSELVRKSDITNALSIIEELGQLNQKRELLEDGDELMELSKRADSLLAELISALTSSGIITHVWTFLTTDSTLRTGIFNLIKKAVTLAITDGPTIIKAVFDSGYIQKFFSLIYNNTSLRATLFSVAKTIFSSGLNLLKAFLANRTSTTAATTAAKREVETREVAEFNSEEFYDKRDLISVAETVYTAIKNTGIVQSLVTKVLADPSAAISFLSSALKTGLVVAEDIYGWAKSSGILTSGLNWIGAHGGTFAGEIAQFLGGQIANGNATVSDIDNASTASTTTTTTKAVTASSTALAKRLY